MSVLQQKLWTGMYRCLNMAAPRIKNYVSQYAIAGPADGVTPTALPRTAELELQDCTITAWKSCFVDR